MMFCFDEAPELPLLMQGRRQTTEAARVEQHQHYAGDDAVACASRSAVEVSRDPAGSSHGFPHRRHRWSETAYDQVLRIMHGAGALRPLDQGKI